MLRIFSYFCSNTLWSYHLNKSTTHLTPCIVIILLTIFPILYFTSCDYFNNWQFVLLNNFHLFCPSLNSPKYIFTIKFIFYSLPKTKFNDYRAYNALVFMILLYLFSIIYNNWDLSTLFISYQVKLSVISLFTTWY